MNKNQYNISWLLVRKTNIDNKTHWTIVHTIGASGNANKLGMRNDTANRFNRLFGNIEWNHIKKVVHKDNDEATLVQRRFNQIWKMQYNAGTGNIVFTSNQEKDILNAIVESYKVSLDLSIDDITPQYDLVNRTIHTTDKEGLVYIMKLPFKDIYKIGETNFNKGAEGRLKEMKDINELPNDTIVYATKKSPFCTYIEGYLHAKYFNHKLDATELASIRKDLKTNHKEYRNGCDEFFRLETNDIDTIIKDFNFTMEV